MSQKIELCQENARSEEIQPPADEGVSTLIKSKIKYMINFQVRINLLTFLTD